MSDLKTWYEEALFTDDDLAAADDAFENVAIGMDPLAAALSETVPRVACHVLDNLIERYTAAADTDRYTDAYINNLIATQLADVRDKIRAAAT